MGSPSHRRRGRGCEAAVALQSQRTAGTRRGKRAGGLADWGRGRPAAAGGRAAGLWGCPRHRFRILEGRMPRRRWYAVESNSAACLHSSCGMLKRGSASLGMSTGPQRTTSHGLSGLTGGETGWSEGARAGAWRSVAQRSSRRSGCTASPLQGSIVWCVSSPGASAPGSGRSALRAWKTPSLAHQARLMRLTAVVL